MYNEHSHIKEYRRGKVEIEFYYSVLYWLSDGSIYNSEETFYEYELALKRYDELKINGQYGLIVLNENQIHKITRLCHINE